MSVMMVQTNCKLNNTELFLKLFHIQSKEIEGLRAKRAYVGFWPIFVFLQDRANFSQTELLDMKRIIP